MTYKTILLAPLYLSTPGGKETSQQNPWIMWKLTKTYKHDGYRISTHKKTDPFLEEIKQLTQDSMTSRIFL